MAVTGNPETLAAAADVLAGTADRLDGFRSGVGDPTVRAYGDWHGTAAPVAAARLRGDLDVLAAATLACRAVAPALRLYADQLARARRDVDDGAAEPDTDLGAHIVQSAEDGVALAAEDAARAVRDATALLPELVDADGGTLLDGLRKAGGDAVDEVASTLAGALDHVNPFSDRFGEAWSGTGATITAAVTDPAGALGAVVDGVTAPIADSYRTGGVDEATGRGLGTIAAALLGGKGVTKLGKLVPEAAPAPTGISPPQFARPQTRLAPGGGLQRHEELGGHTLAAGKAHVGATDQQMLDRLESNPRLRHVSSYKDRATAEAAVNETVRKANVKIDDWLRNPGAGPKLTLEGRHIQIIGRSAVAGGGHEGIVDETRSTVVLKRAPSAPGGYYILTSYPGV